MTTLPLSSELHKFIFEGLPVRGMLVKLTGSWQEVLQRRATNAQTGAYPLPVQNLLGQMAAASVLMQSNIKFNGALVMQIFGDGPVKVAVAEVQPDLSFRCTAKVVGDMASDASLSQIVNLHNQGRCAITLDPKDKLPGQQPYQGVVPLFGDQHQKLEQLSEVLEHYMLQSEQLDTKLILAANSQVAAGLLIQRLPVEGEKNLSAEKLAQANEDEIGLNEHYNRISILAASLTHDELLNLDAHVVLHRLFWEEKLLRYEPAQPRFACTCSRTRVSQMIRGLGTDEAQSIITERGLIEVACDFCAAQYRFDAVDAMEIFTAPKDHPPGTAVVQ
jgi:molecular chaperone Hsp33